MGSKLEIGVLIPLQNSYMIDRYDSLPDVSIFIHSLRYQWHNEDPMYGMCLLRCVDDGSGQSMRPCRQQENLGRTNVQEHGWGEVQYSLTDLSSI